MFDPSLTPKGAGNDGTSGGDGGELVPRPPAGDSTREVDSISKVYLRTKNEGIEWVQRGP